jgi:hypothetical protein
MRKMMESLFCRWHLENLGNFPRSWYPLRSVVFQYGIFWSMVGVVFVMFEILMVGAMLVTRSPLGEVALMGVAVPILFVPGYALTVVCFGVRFHIILVTLFRSHERVLDLDLTRFVRRHIQRTRPLHLLLCRLRRLSLDEISSAVLGPSDDAPRSPVA